MKKNSRIHIYYVLLGLGIGLVLGSIINIISPNVIVRDYTDEEIIQRARELGMLSLDEIIQKNEENNDDSNKQNINNDANDTETLEYIEFEVSEGDSSEKVTDNLFEANIIDNKEEFTKAIFRRKADRKIHFGKFKIPKGADYDTIIDILIK